MPSFFEIPLSGSPQTFSIPLGGITYRLTFLYHPTDADLAGWTVDIADINGESIIAGIPLVTGVNLLAQYAYLNIGNGIGLVVVSDGDPTAVPTFAGLGTTGHLYIITSP